MRTCIERVRDQASNAKAKKDALDRPLKLQNLDLYYGYLHMKCYYFCQQYEDHFEVAGSLGNKRVPFVVGFLKHCILLS